MKRKLAFSVILFAIISATVVWLFLPENRQNVFRLPPQKEPLLVSRAELNQYTNETLPGKILCAGESILTPEYIYVMNANEDKMTRLTKIPSNGDPAWSADGTKILFVSWSRITRFGAINTINPDNTNLTKVIAIRGASRFIWSPDGTRIAFVYPPDVNSNDQCICVVDARWRNPIRVSKNYDLIEGLPDWSPDGEWIVFGAEGNIHIAKTDGSIEVQLTKNETMSFFDPVWSSN